MKKSDKNLTKNSGRRPVGLGITTALQGVTLMDPTSEKREELQPWQILIGCRNLHVYMFTLQSTIHTLRNLTIQPFVCLALFSLDFLKCQNTCELVTARGLRTCTSWCFFLYPRISTCNFERSAGLPYTDIFNCLRR